MNKLLLTISSIILLACNTSYTASQDNNILHQQTMDNETYMREVNQVFNEITKNFEELISIDITALNRSFTHYREINNIIKYTKIKTQDFLNQRYNPNDMIKFYDNTIEKLQGILNDTNENSTSNINLTDTNELDISSKKLDDITENDVIKATIKTCKSLIQLNEQLLLLMEYKNKYINNTDK